MNAEQFIDGIRDDNDTALSRLGSSKALYADTAGEMGEETVLSAAADAEHHAAVTYQQWADNEGNDEVADAFAETAAEERDHYERVAGKLDDHEPSEGVPAIQDYLRGLDGTVERLGGFVGRTIAAEKSKEQFTGYFVGEADPQTAQLFRDVGSDLDPQLDRAGELLESVCESDDDWEQAAEAATGAIQTAYDAYTESLESMGVNPKPVC
ncbi:ferritin family protein [Halorhabdus sp. BNX81]|uniref:ferritin family protein n=1 Tax=Halorhabdus sp. BNX81 TaxID=2980181 RepID=UPI0023DD31AC|nr:ferritin family protein [Halorhabdus sp. BNX81]WEL22241.1 Ferritin family protein [Halorhabdus sp. BNX81]